MIIFGLILAAYIIGSFQWGLLLVKLLHRVDVRNYGSGNTGVTNVLRVAGKKAALLTLIGDAGKGTVIVIVARLLTPDETIHALAAVMVITGHIWPLFSRFRGGRGIATGGGAAIALAPLVAVFALGIFIPVVVFTRIVSLGSILAVCTVAIFFLVGWLWFSYPIQYLMFSVSGGGFILLMHRQNMRRIFNGTERRIDGKSEI